MSHKNDYLEVLNALGDIPFSVGKRLLIDYLRGDKTNESITRNTLFKNKSFGALAYETHELEEIIELLLHNDMLRYVPIRGKKFLKVLSITEKGIKELKKPTALKPLPQKKESVFTDVFSDKISPVTDGDKITFELFGELLKGFNDEQKKAIISDKKNILCIAGAGSGKTTVLTKRLEFLINYRSVKPQNVLAITFTRKARAEMIHRLSNMTNTSTVQVETFNSFCEKILKHHNHMIYDKDVRVIDYKDRFLIMNKALMHLRVSKEHAINSYFSFAQKRSKTPEQLATIFMNDCFFIRDYMKLKSCDVEAMGKEVPAAKIVFDICRFIDDYMQTHGLRDYADQLVDTIRLFTKHPGLIPNFTHVFIDEYQDVNAIQTQLIDILKPANIFAVGDPRQSIYGWRGSDIRYLLNFNEKYPEYELLGLTQNYRSTKKIVNLINLSIKHMNISDLTSTIETNSDVRLLKFDNEDAEFEFIIQSIIKSDIKRKEIFVLARTNRQLVELSGVMRQRGISHVLRSDELRKTAEAKEEDVTLATIHAIKGLEAELVFVIGCTYTNFPCKASEHPVVEMVKIEEYNKEDEERRLFYVAMSRAKKSLYLTYSGTKHTPYIIEGMLPFFDNKIKPTKSNKLPVGVKYDGTNVDISSNVCLKPSHSSENMMSRLKEWRNQKSKKENMPAYIIMHDSTIIDLVQKNPTTKEDLQDIRGLGPTKIMRYGEEILDILNGC